MRRIWPFCYLRTDMEPNASTAVLIHGCHLQASLNGQTWRDIVWGGDMPTLYGRATMGLKVAFEQNADAIIFSTGASELNGVKEGQVTRDYALEHVESIAKAIDADTDELRRMIEDRSELDIESQNTREECERNLGLCADMGVEQVFIVSSPWHIQRCITAAQIVLEGMRVGGAVLLPDLIAIPSYGSTEGVVVFEPSHRGDMPKNRLAELGGRFFTVPPHRLPELESGIERLLVAVGAP